MSYHIFKGLQQAAHMWCKRHYIIDIQSSLVKERLVQ